MGDNKTTVYARTLQRAADILGGKEKLRAYLRVPKHRLEAWLDDAEPPMDIFLKAVDVVNAATAQADGKLSSGNAALLAAVLDAAMFAVRADMGNVQVAAADGLRIVAQRGFDQPFLDFFALVKTDTACACGRALATGRRIVVEDVATDPLFAGNTAGAVIMEAGARAVQSTPILSATGKLVGVLSTHSREPHTPSASQLAALDDIASRVGNSLGA